MALGSSPNLISIIFLVHVAACVPGKSPKFKGILPSKATDSDGTQQNEAPNENVLGPSNNPGNVPLPGQPNVTAGLVVANDKLVSEAGTLTAKITFAGKSVSKDFTPTGATSLFSIAELPASADALLTVEIYKGVDLKFVAKRARTSLLNPAADAVVIDNCLLLSTPWDGKNNDGGCSWLIEESP